MTEEEVYRQLLQKVKSSSERPCRVILKNVGTLTTRSDSNTPLLDLVCDLVNRRMDLEEEDQKKNIPIFRHIQLKENDYDQVDLEVILQDEVIPHLKS